MFATSGLIVLLLLTIAASLYFMNTMVRRTAELSALKTDFVSAVSHEMRTPLATIRMIAEMFQMERVKDLRTSQEYIETVTSETERLTRLINKVLDFSRMDSGRKPYSFVPAALGPLVDATVKNFEAGISQDCRIDVAIEPDLPEARVDEDAIVQALINLLDNAVKYSPEPGQVQVTLSRRGAELLLQVADRGIGIDPRKLGMIFEKFYRCEDELTRRTTGTGIGLSIVKHIAEAHGGRIEVQSAPGQGSVFTLHLPLPASIPLTPL
jgi:signal transduction histidine kinase